MELKLENQIDTAFEKFKKKLADTVPAEVYSRNQYGGTTRRMKLSDEEIEDLFRLMDEIKSFCLESNISQRQATIAGLWKIACSEDNPEAAAMALMREVARLYAEGHTINVSPSPESNAEETSPTTTGGENNL
jgi:hypothetical protein